MAVHYLVKLEPLSTSDQEGHVLISPGKKTFAVISDSKVIARNTDPYELGREYGCAEFPTSCVLLYDCPFDSFRTKEGIFRVLNFPNKLESKFERGELEGFLKKRSKP